jgi:FkbM family methyltransferase
LEADDYIFYVLEQNIKANNCQNIQPIFGAVYNKTGKVMIYPVQDFDKFICYGSFGLDPNTTEGRQVQTIAIDDLKIDREVSFMKVDVQGSDLFAMQGAIETIKKYRMPIIFEFEQQFQKQFNTCFQDYLDFIASINYKVEEVVDNINYLIVPKV